MRDNIIIIPRHVHVSTIMYMTQNDVIIAVMAHDNDVYPPESMWYETRKYRVYQHRDQDEKISIMHVPSRQVEQFTVEEVQTLAHVLESAARCHNALNKRDNIDETIKASIDDLKS